MSSLLYNLFKIVPLFITMVKLLKDNLSVVYVNEQCAHFRDVTHSSFAFREYLGAGQGRSGTHFKPWSFIP